ncbi:MAG TPA: hypothetical protein VMM77_12085 [Gemmatimonadaceae bacterium]|nr:hypothetical protein [Gemmatimonadaceae bacterium]
MYRIVQISTTNRAGAIALGIAAVAIGGVFVVFGLMLLIGLAAVGTLVGAGLVLYHRLTGRLPSFLRGKTQPARTLHPELEVFAAEPLESEKRTTDLPNMPPIHRE